MKHVAFFGGRERFPLLSTMRAAEPLLAVFVHLDWIPFRLIDNLRPSNPSSVIHFSLRKPKTCFSFLFGSTSRLLSAERAALGQAGLTTGRLAKDLGAAGADNDGLGVREDGGDGEATGALDVHEEGARAGDKHLLRVRRCLCGC
jgi:hypothetical protein